MYIYLHIIYVHFPRSMFTSRLHKHTPQITSNPCECECCGHSVEPMQCLASSVGWSRLWPGSISARSVMLRVAGATCGKAPRLSSGCLTSGMRLQTFGWSRLWQGSAPLLWDQRCLRDAPANLGTNTTGSRIAAAGIRSISMVCSNTTEVITEDVCSLRTGPLSSSPTPRCPGCNSGPSC